jgi:hypothetical protein
VRCVEHRFDDAAGVGSALVGRSSPSHFQQTATGARRDPTATTATERLRGQFEERLAARTRRSRRARPRSQAVYSGPAPRGRACGSDRDRTSPFAGARSKARRTARTGAGECLAKQPDKGFAGRCRRSASACRPATLLRHEPSVSVLPLWKTQLRVTLAWLGPAQMPSKARPSLKSAMPRRPSAAAREPALLGRLGTVVPARQKLPAQHPLRGTLRTRMRLPIRMDGPGSLLLRHGRVRGERLCGLARNWRAPCACRTFLSSFG